MKKPISIIVGKFIILISRLWGGGSALPGLIVEKIDPNFLHRTLADLSEGVVLISGTNGKTTTTKMVVELLESQGLKVFTNRTGSNFTRGVVASALRDVNFKGKLSADIAVLELDEAYAVHFIKQVKPKYSLLLNVLRDQLDRFGEIDYTASLLGRVAEATTEAVVINRDDPRLNSPKFLQNISSRVVWFGVAPNLKQVFLTDEELHAKNLSDNKILNLGEPLTVLKSFKDSRAVFCHRGKEYPVELALTGIHNLQNLTGALVLVETIIGDGFNFKQILRESAKIKPAFGRGESIMVDGQSVSLHLVKNPSGFRLSLESFASSKSATMIAVNDEYADGRDISWLWDVDFSSFPGGEIAMVSGTRAYDMALRLQYDEVKVNDIQIDLEKALKQFLMSNKDKSKQVFCTYTAMLKLRKELGRFTKVEQIK